MGRLREVAKKNSNYLKLEKGESVVVQYIGYRIIPNSMDPSKESVMYQFREDGKDKYWTNGNSRIMNLMDDVKTGAWVRVMRNKAMNKDGSEDVSKSQWEVEEVNEDGTVIRSSAMPNGEGYRPAGEDEWPE